MEERVWEYICRHGMLEKNDRVVAGISGGADSVCLFFLFLKFRERIPFELCAVHVDHGIRGEEALEDARFTEELCRRYEVEYRLFRCPVQKRARTEHISVEEAGRKARYEVFDRVMKEWNGTKIVVAHHRNDQAETLLLNLFRGTGLSGMTGMKPVQGVICRPLLCVSRREIEEWLAGQKLSYRTDSTNLEDTYARNRVRRRILPEACKVNERAVEHLAAACDAAAEAQAYLERETAGAFARIVSARGEELILDQEQFALEDPLIQKYVLKRALEQCGGGRDIGTVHLSALLSLMEGGTGRQWDLPHGLYARRSYGRLYIGRMPETLKDISGEFTPLIPGTVSLPDGGRLSFWIEAYKKEQDIPIKTYTKWFDYDKIISGLRLRTRRPGDDIAVNSRGGTKKLKDYFIDEKIEREKRGRIWLLADGNHILWVIGHRISEAYKVTDQTKRVLKVQADGGNYDE